MAELSTTTIWLVIIAGAIGTFAIRLSFIAIFGQLESTPPRLDLVLRYVPAAVLAGLVAPALFAPSGTLAISIDNHHLIAGSIAGVVAWRTENMVATIAVGMGALWALTWLL